LIPRKILDPSFLVATDGSGDDSEDEEERRDEGEHDEEDAETEELGDLDSPVCDFSLCSVVAYGPSRSENERPLQRKK